MHNWNTLIVFLLIIGGVLGVLMDISSVFPDFYSEYCSAIELYLFIFSAFLVLKRVFFYRIKGNVKIIQVSKKSNHYSRLLVQGIILTVFYSAYLYIYGQWATFDAVMIGVLLLYYIGQLLINGNPSIYIDDQALAFDDFFIQQWQWQDIDDISFENTKLSVAGKNRNLELDLSTIDQIDQKKLSWEVDASILDGTFVKQDSSKVLLSTIKSYANQYGVNHNLS